MTTYYNVTLTTNIPHGSAILNKPCTVVFNNADGSHVGPYPGTVFAWPNQNTVRISSAVMNIETGWTGHGGTLTIAAGGGLVYGIAAFAQM